MKIVLNQISNFVISNNILKFDQSDLRAHHNMDTAPVKILDDIRSNMDNKNLSVWSCWILQQPWTLWTTAFFWINCITQLVSGVFQLA